MDIRQSPLLFLILLITSIVGLFISAYYIISKKEKRGYLLAPFSLFLDVFLFYTMLYLETYGIIDILNTQQLLNWSGLARLHGLLVILTYLIVEPKRSKCDGKD